jgi:drug/metabolite transporter, DME family
MTARTGSLLILAASVLWGTTGTAQALAPPGARPLAVASLRVVLGGAVLVGLAARRRPRVGASSVGPALLAAASLVVAQLCFFTAVERTGVAVGTIVAIGFAPVAAGGLEWAFGTGSAGPQNKRARRRPTRRWMLATVLAVAGCALLLVVGRSVDVDAAGVGLALVVGLGYAGYTLSTKLLVKDLRPEVATAVVFAVAAVMMLPVLVRVDLAWVADTSGALIALHLSVMTVALAYSLFARALVSVPASTAVTLTLAEPLTAGLLGIAVLGERLSPPALAGVALVLSGLTVVATSGSRRETAATVQT